MLFVSSTTLFDLGALVGSFGAEVIVYKALLTLPATRMLKILAGRDFRSAVYELLTGLFYLEVLKVVLPMTDGRKSIRLFESTFY